MLNEVQPPNAEMMEIWRDFKGQMISDVKCRSVSLIPLCGKWNDLGLSESVLQLVDEHLSQCEDLFILKLVQGFEKYHLFHSTRLRGNLIHNETDLRVLALFCGLSEKECDFLRNLTKIDTDSGANDRFQSMGMKCVDSEYTDVYPNKKNTFKITEDFHSEQKKERFCDKAENYEMHSDESFTTDTDQETSHSISCKKTNSHQFSKAVECIQIQANVSSKPNAGTSKTSFKPQHQLKTYECHYCGQKFSSKSLLKVHRRTHEKTYICDQCNASFSESSKLKIHMRSHTGERPYVCEVCGNAFSQLSNLHSHMKTHTGVKPFRCNLCPFITAHSSNLKVHLRSHSGEKTFVCETCGASFADSARLKRHVMVHTGEKPFHCEVCGTRFADKSHLNVHMRIHSGDKPFKCHVCTAAFRESSKLKTHLRTHTGERPYICEVCGATFAVPYGLKSHMRRHTGEKPYICQVCGFATSQSSNLKSHMTVHTGNKQHTCTECGASFGELAKLHRHQKVHIDPAEEEKPDVWTRTKSSTSVQNSFTQIVKSGSGRLSLTSTGQWE